MTNANKVDLAAASDFLPQEQLDRQSVEFA